MALTGKTNEEKIWNYLKAAGLTADLVCGSGMPPTEKREVILDLPFAFMILGTGNVPIFAGIVNSIDQ